VYVNM